ncbi:MAG: tRNA (adenosine(37)-N6)-threonylcarbamoyltransferase complex dimerization subunit type 1 TsaB [Caldicoprobacterales bacterium]|jgi:tRNA threonylcarbamoyladenosine biosynthesis protein TsaB|nr:tRNA (adenosine(37)-N6)-threonylcarbamoyltransferase complex dimerization subunit type 1 TsaB [Clostridiales bacterium]
MKVLAVDSSSVVAGVAILSEDRLLYEAYHHHRKNHSELLMPLVEDALNSSDLKPDDLDLLAVSGGPGSFTGLRIGISTIKGLAQAIEKPVVSVPTLDALAWNIAGVNGLVCPLMDARREQVYTSLYRREGSECIRLMPYSAIPVVELTEQLAAYRQPIIFLGDGLWAYQALLQEQLKEYAHFAPAHLICQRASAIAWLGRKEALAGNAVHYKELRPFYLRQSQAEQKRLKQAGDRT